MNWIQSLGRTISTNSHERGVEGMTTGLGTKSSRALAVSTPFRSAEQKPPFSLINERNESSLVFSCFKTERK